MAVKRSALIAIWILLAGTVFADPAVSTLGNTAVLLDQASIFASAPSASVLHDGMGWDLSFKNIYDYRCFDLTGLYAKTGKWVFGGFGHYSFVENVIRQWDAGLGFGVALTPDLAWGLSAEVGYDVIEGYSQNGTADPVFGQRYLHTATATSLTYLPLEDLALHAGWNMSFDTRVERELELAISYVLPFELRSVVGADFKYDFSRKVYDISFGAVAYWEHFSVDLGISGSALGIGFGFMINGFQCHVGMSDDFDLGRTVTFSVGWGGADD